MTTNTTVQAIELPEPKYPMVTRMISNSLFPDTQDKVVGCPHCKQSIKVPMPADKRESEPITWVIGQPHPLIPDMRVMRMFSGEVDIDVYSVSADGKACVLHTVPKSTVRITEYAMPIDVFVDELRSAEEDDDDDPDPEPGNRTPEPLPAVPVANGQPPS